jgi:26S proteasome regulatory subunit N5
MQEVAVETYGALSKEEKVAFVLEQVRLVLDRGDYARAQILAKKVNPRTFAELDKKDGKPPKRDSTIVPPEEVRSTCLCRLPHRETSTRGRG